VVDDFRSGGRSVAHGVSRGEESVINELAGGRRHIKTVDYVSPSGPSLFLLPGPMAYAMGYRSNAAPRLTKA